MDKQETVFPARPKRRPPPPYSGERAALNMCNEILDVLGRLYQATGTEKFRRRYSRLDRTVRAYLIAHGRLKDGS